MSAAPQSFGGDDRPRIDEIEMADGEFVVYDRENEDAWLEAELGVDLEGHR